MPLAKMFFSTIVNVKRIIKNEWVDILNTKATTFLNTKSCDPVLIKGYVHSHPKVGLVRVGV